MDLSIISYDMLHSPASKSIIEHALFHKGIIGVKDIPTFETRSLNYITAARQFAGLEESIKKKYAPNRDRGETEGYELGAEWFQNSEGIWQIDEKKASYYAYVPDHFLNKWPNELNLRIPYLELGEVIFSTGKVLLNAIGLNDDVKLSHQKIVGYGRMLHYHKENKSFASTSDWCGAHFDHGIFTGLIPAYYFQDGKLVDEPKDAGLYIKPTNGNDFEKVDASDKSVLFFQVGEFGQLISNDRIKATKHMVKKAECGYERFTFALFYNAHGCMTIQSKSILNQDPRYLQNQTEDGCINYQDWEKASYEKYRVT